MDKFVKKYNIKVIINCAAYTAVEKAESDPEIADLINHLAVANFAKVSKNIKSSLFTFQLIMFLTVKEPSLTLRTVLQIQNLYMEKPN